MTTTRIKGGIAATPIAALLAGTGSAGGAGFSANWNHAPATSDTISTSGPVSDSQDKVLVPGTNDLWVAGMSDPLSPDGTVVSEGSPMTLLSQILS